MVAPRRASGGPAGGVGGARVPQSKQSAPIAQIWNSAPGPPSSQSPSLLYAQSS